MLFIKIEYAILFYGHFSVYICFQDFSLWCMQQSSCSYCYRQCFEHMGDFFLFGSHLSLTNPVCMGSYIHLFEKGIEMSFFLMWTKIAIHQSKVISSLHKKMLIVVSKNKACIFLEVVQYSVNHPLSIFYMRWWFIFSSTKRHY